MRIAVIQISEAGTTIATTLRSALTVDGDSVAVTIPRAAVATHWHDYEAFVFIGAMGTCVRTIAPFVEDKHTDPAVVCIDSLGRHVISVLSGHIGGANDLTHRIAAILGAEPVVTTQSDNAGLWALDTLEQRFGWSVASYIGDMNDCIFAFVDRQPTALL
ncbi:MAG: precorrin-4 C(11)-methyltransferase, partial [Prevotella sp.]|nr:precorrin-4 C(11)-methyltransferase [Prevotella sp.]